MIIYCFITIGKFVYLQLENQILGAILRRFLSIGIFKHNPLMDSMNFVYSPKNIRSPLKIKLALMYYSVYYKQRPFYLQMFGGRVIWKSSSFWWFFFENCGVNYTNFLVFYLLSLFISAMFAPFPEGQQGSVREWHRLYHIVHTLLLAWFVWRSSRTTRTYMNGLVVIWVQAEPYQLL